MGSRLRSALSRFYTYVDHIKIDQYSLSYIMVSRLYDGSLLRGLYRGYRVDIERRPPRAHLTRTLHAECQRNPAQCMGRFMDAPYIGCYIGLYRYCDLL